MLWKLLGPVFGQAYTTTSWVERGYNLASSLGGFLSKPVTPKSHQKSEYLRLV